MTTNILTSDNRKDWGDASFWAKICPKLSIESDAKEASTSSDVDDKFLPNADEAERRRKQLVEEGFVLVDDTLDRSLIEKVREGVIALQDGTETKFPASFILLFDETWELARVSREILRRSSHKANDFNFDILSWHIESGGFSPHRDRQPDNSSGSFHKDEQAKFITHWIALSDATPENSCLYVIPKSQDPGYKEGDSDTEEPLRRALPTKESFQKIRALPRESGTSLLFTHRIIHWGSARVPSTNMPPRTAISFVCSDPDYEKPYIDPKYFTSSENPPFHIRLLLVCAQLLIYYQRFDLPKDTIKACYEYCKENVDKLEESYRHKVFLEFVNAMKTFNAGDETEPKTASGDITVSINDDDDDDEDAVMEEMLNAEEGGYGEFDDDYDEANGSDDKQQHDAGSDDEDDFEDEEEGVSLFGNKSGPPAKKLKTAT